MVVPFEGRVLSNGVSKVVVDYVAENFTLNVVKVDGNTDGLSPMDYPKMNAAQLSQGGTNLQQLPTTTATGTNRVDNNYGGGYSSPYSNSCSLPSPYPQLDTYVASFLASIGAKNAGYPSTHSLSSSGTHRSITYNMRGNRFCSVIGRYHKSNNIYWTVDLNNMCYKQGCHDMECRNLVSMRGGKFTEGEIKDEGVRQYLEEVKLEMEMNLVWELAEKKNDEKLGGATMNKENNIGNFDEQVAVGKSQLLQPPTITNDVNDSFDFLIAQAIKNYPERWGV